MERIIVVKTTKSYDKKTPNIVYHYTSPEVICSIVRNKCIWFSDINFMNDRSEFIYFINLLKDFFEGNKGKYPYCESAFDCLLRFNNEANTIVGIPPHMYRYDLSDEDRPNELRQFIFCASRQRDLLEMWNYYIQSSQYHGYNLGINIELLLKNASLNKYKDCLSVAAHSVIYNKEKQMSIIERQIIRIEKESKRNILICKIKMIESEYFTIDRIKDFIMKTSCFFKDQSFANEQEFRIVISCSNENIQNRIIKNNTGDKKSLIYGFNTKNGLIVPHIEVPINLDNIIEVTTAPTMETELAKEGVKHLFLSAGKSDIEVKSSTIPVRF